MIRWNCDSNDIWHHNELHNYIITNCICQGRIRVLAMNGKMSFRNAKPFLGLLLVPGLLCQVLQLPRIL